MENSSPEEMLQIAIAQIATGSAKIGPAIDKLTSSNLKRVLKAITYIRLSEEILGQDAPPLSNDENKLITDILLHQENIMGYMALDQEINGEQEINTEGESNE